MARDLVCDMQVGPGIAVAKSVYQGQTFHFCSNLRKLMFDREAEKFMKKSDADTDRISHS